MREEKAEGDQWRAEEKTDRPAVRAEDIPEEAYRALARVVFLAVEEEKRAALESERAEGGA